MNQRIIEKLKKEIAGIAPSNAVRDVGIVAEASDGIVRITGLEHAMSQELLSIENTSGENISALVFNLEEDSIGAVLLDSETGVAAGSRARSTGRVLSLPVGKFLIGRVIDPLGRPLDGKGILFLPNEEREEYPLERTAPSVVERESVKAPLHTGITAIDAMIPIGRGQRELIIGDRQTGKTSIVLDTILNQHPSRGEKPVTCIYVAVGQKQSKIAATQRMLEAAGALEYTVIVAAPASAPASLQYLAPYAGAAIGEFFMEQGGDALVIFDDLSKHAVAYRQLSLLLKRPPGREAYPGDIFYVHSRLLERAAKLNKERGGGSLTALPIIETQLGDVSAYIPTNVISITDGQIYLESALFYQGIRPAVNVGLSVSRVGSSAQTKAMKRVAGKLRLELAQFRELAAFAQFASDLDERTRERLERGKLLTEILKQPDRSPRPLTEEVLTLHAALGGIFDGISPNAISPALASYLAYVERLHADDVVKSLSQSLQISDELDKQITEVERSWRKTFSH